MSDQHSISNFIDNVKGDMESPSELDGVISEGISHLKEKISKVEVKPPEKKEKPVAKPEEKDLKPLADRAIDTYKTKIKPAKGAEAGELEVVTPNTIASREATKAAVRALTGQRGSGDAGKTAQTLPSGAGNVGNNDLPPVGLQPVTLSMEEYKHEIFASFGITERFDDMPKDDVGWEVHKKAVKANQSAVDAVNKPKKGKKELKKESVEILEHCLREMEVGDWMEVDKVTRLVAEELEIGVKELNKAFKEENGVYPDKWIREQVTYTACGWMPIDEAVRVNKVGLVYEVSFVYRGKTMRYKFFWPSPNRPTRDEIQSAIDGFYPKARVLAYYPAVKQDENFMVIVPPVSENVQVFHYDDWMELSEEANEAFHIIAEEVGEPLGVPYELEEGYSVIVEDHDTGEQVEVEFHEDWQKVNRKDKTDGMSQKAVNAYRRENPGSKLKTAVTEKNPTGKRAGRRKSYCSRSAGQQKMHNIDCSKTPDKRICKARRRWNC